MSNLDTTTPISEFNVVDKNGNTTLVPLSASGGGKTLYQHNIFIQATNPNYRVTTQIINDTPDVFTVETLASYLYSNGFTAATRSLQASGVGYGVTDTTGFGTVYNIYGNSTGKIMSGVFTYKITLTDGVLSGSNTTAVAQLTSSATVNVIDTVVEV